MTRLLTIAAIVTSTMMLANESRASGPSHSNQSGHMSSYRSHNGHNFSFYRGYDHRHWSSWRWNSTYNCYFYFCPNCNYEFYWYAPSQCYFPVTYIQQYQPSYVSYRPITPNTVPLPVVQTQAQAQAQSQAVNVQVTNVNNNGTPIIGGPAPIVAPGPGPIAAPGPIAPPPGPVAVAPGPIAASNSAAAIVPVKP